MGLHGETYRYVYTISVLCYREKVKFGHTVWMGDDSVYIFLVALCLSFVPVERLEGDFSLLHKNVCPYTFLTLTYVAYCIRRHTFPTDVLSPKL